MIYCVIVQYFPDEICIFVGTNFFLMKKTYSLLSVLAVVIIISSYSSGPPAGTTNAPNEFSCADNGACHVGALPNSGKSVFGITLMDGIPPKGYVPGQTYMLMPYIVDDLIKVFGFEMIAKLANGQGAGTVIITDPTKTQIITSTNNLQYVGHTQAGTANPGMHGWMYDWKAPAAGFGTVTLYAVFVAANGNGKASGDTVYTASLVLKEDTTVGIQNIVHTDFIVGKIFPLPTNNFINIQFNTNKTMGFSITVLDINGKEVIQENLLSVNKSNALHTINLSSLSQGIYFLKIIHQDNKTVFIQKIVKT